MSPGWENISFSSVLPSNSLISVLRGFLSWHSALQGPSPSTNMKLQVLHTGIQVWTYTRDTSHNSPRTFSKKLTQTLIENTLACIYSKMWGWLPFCPLPECKLYGFVGKRDINMSPSSYTVLPKKNHMLLLLWVYPCWRGLRHYHALYHLTFMTWLCGRRTKGPLTFSLFSLRMWHALNGQLHITEWAQIEVIFLAFVDGLNSNAWSISGSAKAGKCLPLGLSGYWTISSELSTKWMYVWKALFYCTVKL